MATSATNVNNTDEAIFIIGHITDHIMSIQEDYFVEDVDEQGPTEMQWILRIIVMVNGVQETQDYRRFVNISNGTNEPYRLSYRGPNPPRNPLFNEENIDIEEEEDDNYLHALWAEEATALAPEQDIPVPDWVWDNEWMEMKNSIEDTRFVVQPLEPII